MPAILLIDKDPTDLFLDCLEVIDAVQPIRPDLNDALTQPYVSLHSPERLLHASPWGHLFVPPPGSLPDLSLKIKSLTLSVPRW